MNNKNDFGRLINRRKGRWSEVYSKVISEKYFKNFERPTKKHERKVNYSKIFSAAYVSTILDKLFGMQKIWTRNF